MTYCVGMLLDEGLVCLSDSRTNAGVDNISTFRKTTVFETHGDRVLVLMTAGNLVASRPVHTSTCNRPGCARSSKVCRWCALRIPASPR